MSGADLANLVNEAALHAVRRGSQVVEMRDFDAARDRVLMGQQRDSLVLSEPEKERIAYHETERTRSVSYVLPFADPLLKVSIIPTGLALGVTQQLPIEEKHIYSAEYVEDSLCVRMGGRVAEKIVYDDLSTGASDDLQRNNGPSSPARWCAASGACPTGSVRWRGAPRARSSWAKTLMHSRDYSEDTSRVVDEEIARILREQEERAQRILEEHRSGLEAVAHTLLERETVDGAEVAEDHRREAHGRPVHGEQSDVAHVVAGITGGTPSPFPLRPGAGPAGEATRPLPTSQSAWATPPEEVNPIPSPWRRGHRSPPPGRLAVTTSGEAPGHLGQVGEVERFAGTHRAEQRWPSTPRRSFHRPA